MSFAKTPPASPWGINFGGGLNSTALIIECRKRGLKPDWIIFADTGSERPETLTHVERMREWCKGWVAITVVKWIRKDGSFESLHDNCLRTKFMPSKAYGYAGCTSKWKVQPMERWRKINDFDHGAFAVGYDAGEHRRIGRACARGDDPDMIAWYPLVAWEIDRAGCDAICQAEGMSVPKSSCFMCPNMKRPEWESLKVEHPDLFDIAVNIEVQARAAGNPGVRAPGAIALLPPQRIAPNPERVAIIQAEMAALEAAAKAVEEKYGETFKDRAEEDEMEAEVGKIVKKTIALGGELRELLIASGEIKPVIIEQDVSAVDDRCHHGGCFT